MISIADVQWVLDHAREPGTVPAEVDRGGKTMSLELAVPKGWRRRGNFADTQSIGWTLRMFVAGMKCDPLSDRDKKQAGLAADALALEIAEITPDFVKRRNTSAQQIGLRKGDIITAVDGMTRARRSPSS